MKPPSLTTPNLNALCVAPVELAEDCEEGTTPNWKPPWTAVELVPAPKIDCADVEAAGNDGPAPGFGASHERHLSTAFDLFKDLHTSHRHSPAFGLNKSASEGRPALAPFAAAGSWAALLVLDAPAALSPRKPSSSSSSLFPEGSKAISTFFSGH